MGFVREVAKVLDLSPKSKKPPEDPEGGPREMGSQPAASFLPSTHSVRGGPTPAPTDADYAGIVTDKKGPQFVGEVDPLRPAKQLSHAPPPGYEIGGAPSNQGAPLTGPYPGALPQHLEGPASRIQSLDFNQQYAQQNQDQLTQMLSQAALGLGPSQAQSLMQTQNDRALRQMQAQGAMGGALGVQQAQMSSPMLQSEMTGQMGAISAQEQQGARALLGTTLDQERQASLQWEKQAANNIQMSNTFNAQVSEQMAKGWQDASGNAVDQTKIALLIQNAIQSQDRFLTTAQIELILAEAGLAKGTGGESSAFTQFGGPVYEGGQTVFDIWT